ncbi:MAG: hypothetical protein ACT4P5_07065 [Armatimonadota bacterium]
MPYFRDVLSTEEIRAVVTDLQGVSPVLRGPPPARVVVPPRVTPDAASIARGRILYGQAGCAVCHGPSGRAVMTLKDAKGHPVQSRDLTAPWTFRGGSQPEQDLVASHHGPATRPDAPRTRS